MAATHEDAALIVQLVRWSNEMALDEAAQELFSDGFDPETASANLPAVRKMLGFGETIGTLVKHDLLDRELVLDLWWIDGMWARVGPPAKAQRDKMGEPRLYENFEALATGS
ncbi:MAG: hypothetical protein ACLP62_15115 [Acidimicrobiales bacterium]